MLYRLKKVMRSSSFAWQTRAILNTSPLNRAAGPLTLVSMVAKGEAQMYILAMKAFYPRIGFGQIVAIVDRDTPADEIQLIRRHLGEVEFVTLEDIHTGRCQRGGTWERILHVLDGSEKGYIIQIDADILTVGDIPEVQTCIRLNRAFTLAEGLPRRSLLEAVEDGHRSDSDHIVIAAEKRFAEYPDPSRHFYIRASSGFAGFAKGGFARARMEEFHENMERIHGKRWREWGTEQIASNFAVANSPDPLVLPNPKYVTHGGNETDSVLYHFIGSYRYKNGTYARLANRVISEYERLNANCLAVVS